MHLVMSVPVVILGLVILLLVALLVLQQRRADAELLRTQVELERVRQEAESKEHLLRNQLDGERQASTTLRSEVSALTASLAALRERMVQSEEERNMLERAAEDRFKNLANEIFATHTTAFRQTSESRIQEILNPLKTNLEDFRKAVNVAYSDEAKERFSLRNEIRNLMELNRSIGKEAQELTRALKGDSKIQGDWGEMILERLLEMSGLRKGIHFRTQVSTNTDGSKLVGGDGQGLRPDVVVFYPDDRCVVIDSKVSLSAYVDYVNATPDSSDLSDAARRHILSVRKHIDELARKQYQDIVGEKRLDFVMMFIPNEGAYLATMNIEPAIWQEAYNKRVLLTSPTHLISVLRMLEQLWKQDAINRNVMEIARLSGTMVDKVVNFMSDLEDVGKSLSSAESAYERARKRLSEGNGNVLVTARKIVALGAKTTKAERLKQIAPDEAPGATDALQE